MESETIQIIDKLLAMTDAELLVSGGVVQLNEVIQQLERDLDEATRLQQRVHQAALQIKERQEIGAGEGPTYFL